MARKSPSTQTLSAHDLARKVRVGNCRLQERGHVYRVSSVVFGLILGTRLITGFAAAAEATQMDLQGSWIATQAERDGKPADDVVGHRLTFAGDRFDIRSSEGEPLFAGTVRTDPAAKPAAIDFEHQSGALNGHAWKGIYVVEGNMLTVCDNAPNEAKDRPTAFEALEGSGYVLLTFKRAEP
jgi:uncharacterized protein (TIGR03067 family)